MCATMALAYGAECKRMLNRQQIPAAPPLSFARRSTRHKQRNQQLCFPAVSAFSR